jgi:hypothetical protein
MDAKAREVVEKRFGVKLDSTQSGEKHQAAWDVYQNAAVKVVKAVTGVGTIDDPASYAATIARNSCRDYWRIRNPGWADLKGRLSRFFRKQPAYALWETDAQRGWICGPANWRNKPVAEGSRVSALIEQPRRIRMAAFPKTEVIEHLDASAWDRLLQGFFEYLKGPLRLDDLVSIAGVLFGVKGSREMAFDELATGEDGPSWEPPAPEPRQDAMAAIREQLAKIWSELKSMPQRWVLPFLLNPHGEIDVFTMNGIATIGEIAALVGLSDLQYVILWRELSVVAAGGPPLEAVPDSKLRFAVIWNLLPLEDGTIARVMGLESGQKVINLRMVAKTHLAKALRTGKKEAGH